MSELPKQWCLAPIRDLIDIQPRNDCPDDIEVGFVPLARLGVHFRSRHTFERRKWADVKSGYTHFGDGDVLLARITPSFENGKAAIASGLPNGLGAGSTEYIVCRPIPDVLLPEYLLSYFKTRSFLEEGASAMSGALGQQRVPKRFVLERVVPLAPLDEQRRIVAKLDAVVRRVDACREHLERVEPAFERLRQSILAAAVDGRLTEPWRATSGTSGDSGVLLERVRNRHRDFAGRAGTRSSRSVGDTQRRRYSFPAPANLSDLGDLPDGWVWASGAEVVEPECEIVYGIVQPGAKLEEGVPYVRGTDVQNGVILVDQLLKTSPDIAGRHSRSSLRAGDVLLGIIRATKVAIVPDVLNGANITQGTARFRPSTVIRTKYLAIALEAPATQAWLHERYRGIDMPGLNLADVRRVPIPLPPLEEQDEIIRSVGKLLSVKDVALRAYSSACEHLNRLTSTLFDRALAGELIAQEPSPESASAVLARVRATRSAKPAVRRRTRTKRKVTMSKITPDSLRHTITGIPSREFTFDQIRDRTSGDYESLRSALFELLLDAEPVLRQVYNEDRRELVFERT